MAADRKRSRGGRGPGHGQGQDLGLVRHGADQDKAGGVAEHEMRRTFNCGVGFIIIVAQADAEPVLAALLNAGEDAFICGQLVKA